MRLGVGRGSREGDAQCAASQPAAGYRSASDGGQFLGTSRSYLTDTT